MAGWLREARYRLQAHNRNHLSYMGYDVKDHDRRRRRDVLHDIGQQTTGAKLHQAQRLMNIQSVALRRNVEELEDQEDELIYHVNELEEETARLLQQGPQQADWDEHEAAMQEEEPQDDMSYGGGEYWDSNIYD